jgi:hypothetical protein
LTGGNDIAALDAGGDCQAIGLQSGDNHTGRLFRPHGVGNVRHDRLN